MTMGERHSKDLQRLIAFLEKKGGSILGAWVRFFDKENTQRGVGDRKFESVLKRLKYEDEWYYAFRDADKERVGEIALEDLDHCQAELWYTFRQWCAKTFETVDDMMWRLGGETALETNRINATQFGNGILQLGWDGGSAELLFDAMAVNKEHELHSEDLEWLKVEVLRVRLRAATKKQVSDRLTRKAASRAARCHPTTVLKKFKKFLVNVHRGYFCAWRSVLCPPGVYSAELSLHKRRFFKACADIGWNHDLGTLWGAFGKDYDTALRIDELDFRTAQLMALFRELLYEHYGSAVAAFNSLGKSKVDKYVFAKLFAEDDDLWTHVQHIFNELSRDETGLANTVRYLTIQDFTFLDSWEPLEYLLAEPNFQAAAQFKAALVKNCKNYVKAWRSVLDTDSSNMCTWDEFKAACEKIEFEGDIGGAWRALDVDEEGSLSLCEIDSASSEILVEFKRWADDTFGSVKSAFGMFDIDRSGEVSRSEWRRGCRMYGFTGSSRLLFDALDVDQGGELGVREVAFLDGWHTVPKLPSRRPAVPTSPRRRSVVNTSFGATVLPPLSASVLRELEKVAIQAVEILGLKPLPALPPLKPSGSSIHGGHGPEASSKRLSIRQDLGKRASRRESRGLPALRLEIMKANTDSNRSETGSVKSFSTTQRSSPRLSLFA